jgi:EAL domain-containing protein (putative c-di-GMP-specific phosphodiesterase class I)
MDYSDSFHEMLQILQQSYKKFPKFLIEITAENYAIPIEQIKSLLLKFRKEGILLIVKDEGYTFTLKTKK